MPKDLKSLTAERQQKILDLNSANQSKEEFSDQEMQVETSVDFGENAGLFGATNETNFDDLN